MFTSLKSFRFLAAVVVAFLMVAGLQAEATAATKRSLSISASPAAGVAGASVVFSGKLGKSPKGTKIVIQRKSGKKWVTAAKTRTTNSAGSYSVKLKRPKKLATYSYRAISAKKGSLRAAKSKTVKVASLKRTLISLSSSTAVATAGVPIKLSGTVLPAKAGTTVTLEQASGKVWKYVDRTTVSAAGIFTKSVTPTVARTIYRAVVSRTSTNAPATSNARTVAAKPVIANTEFPRGSRFGFFTTTLVAKYGAQGTWSAPELTGTGLTLNPKTGVISGTPSSELSKNITVGFTQTGGLAATKKVLTLQVGPAEKPVISTASLPNATRLAPYGPVTLTALGNPAGTWATSELPAGLVLNNGVISGTPTASAETKAVVITFTQTNTGRDASKTLTLTVGNATAPQITTTALPAGTKASVYTPFQLTVATTGNPAGTWTASPLPDGLELNATTGVISGTPTNDAETEQVVIGFKQTSTGVFAVSKTLTLTIGNAATPVIATASLPDGRRLAPYAPFTLTATATGNPTTGTWTASPLPTGLTLNQATGVISGSPSLTAETTQVVIGFTQTGTGLTAVSKTLTLTVLPAAPPEISTTSLPNGTRFQQYAPFTLTATGNPVGTWTASPLPPGLILNQATGVISGTPTVAGDTSVLVGFTQTNTGVAALSKTFTLHVDPALAPVISTANLPQAVRYQPYTTQLTVAGNPVGTWTSTALPVGMSFDPATGVLSGTPRNAGITSITFGFTQENSGLSAASKTLELEVLQAPPVITTAAQLPNGSPLTVYDIQLQVAPAPIGKWTLVAGATPLGVTLKQDGQLSGFPTLPVGANYKFTIRFTETSTGLATDRQFFLKLS